MTHWSPPSPGKSSAVTSINRGSFTTMGDAASRPVVVRPTNGSSVPCKNGKSEDPTIKNKSNRANETLGNQEYGPAGVVRVYRNVTDPAAGCGPCYTIPSAFGPQEGFTAGRATGDKAR